jgi:hypothetical protein
MKKERLVEMNQLTSAPYSVDRVATGAQSSLFSSTFSRRLVRIWKGFNIEERMAEIKRVILNEEAVGNYVCI